MKRIALSAILFFTCIIPIFAQYNTPQNKNWTFGHGSGLTFGSGAPVTFSSSINSNEACAMVSDASGNLLFYTDGSVVYDRTGAIMPSGGDLTGYISSSATQGALIAPVLSNSNQYYVFSIEQMEDYMSSDPDAPRMFYSIIDMTLNSGFGDVVTTSMGIPLTHPTTEKSIAIPGNNCNIWIITHGRDTAQFNAFEITSAGVSTTPVVSNVGTYSGYGAYDIGVLKCSPNRQMILCQADGLFGTGGTELYDFNPTTGVVSNCRVLDSTSTNVYGGDFSPDNTKLYAQGATIAQYDLTVPTSAAIVASKVDIATYPGFAYEDDMKLAPDGKIYLGSITSLGSSYLDCINSPNLSGTACNYVSEAVELTGTIWITLPNLYWAVSGADTNSAHQDTTVCILAGDSITIQAVAGDGYYWYDGDTVRTKRIASAGIYTVKVGSGCGTLFDTITVHASTPDTTHIHADTTICALTGSIVLTAPVGYTHYLWSDGVITATHTVTSSGIYRAMGYNECGAATIDTFHVFFTAPDTTYSSRDTVVCATVDSVIITAPPGYTYLWNTGSTADSVIAFASGDYYVYCHSGCNTLIDTIHVIMTPLGTATEHMDTVFCLPGSIVLSAPQGYRSYAWQDGSTGKTYTSSAAGDFWVDATTGCSHLIDTFHVGSKVLSFSLGNDTLICIDYRLVIPLQGYGITYKWQDGTTDSIYYTDYSGLYYATVYDSGCVATDSINVTYVHLEQNLRDTFICKETPFSINLTATVPDGGSVLWNNGSKDPVRTVTDSGTYWVFISKDQCEILDTVHVVTGYCDCWYQMPDAFTPNNDGLNDVIRPKIQPGCTISGYQFNIFNRWGQTVFSSGTRGEGWDGNYNGTPQDLGVYMYTLQYYVGVGDKPVVRSGSITLLR